MEVGRPYRTRARLLLRRYRSNVYVGDKNFVASFARWLPEYFTKREINITCHTRFKMFRTNPKRIIILINLYTVHRIIIQLAQISEQLTAEFAAQLTAAGAVQLRFLPLGDVQNLMQYLCLAMLQ